MNDLLADHVLLLIRIVVVRRIEVRVVDLDGALRDVAAGHPDRRKPEPAVVAVRPVAHFAAPPRAATIVLRATLDLFQSDDARLRWLFQSAVVMLSPTLIVNGFAVLAQWYVPHEWFASADEAVAPTQNAASP